MANTKQAAKKARQSEKRRMSNRWQISRMNTHIKRVFKAIEDANHEAAMTEYRSACSCIDRLANKGMIHSNKAARLKSRLNGHAKDLIAA